MANTCLARFSLVAENAVLMNVLKIRSVLGMQMGLILGLQNVHSINYLITHPPSLQYRAQSSV